MHAPAQNRVETFFEKNLMAILLAAGSAYAGFVTGQAGSATEMSAIRGSIADLTTKVAALQSTSSARVPALSCMARTIDRVADKAGVEPRCEMGVSQ